MHYNLLNYGNTTTYCTTSNNNLADKDGFLKTVTKYVQPDILTVNEMGANQVYAQRILVNVLNTDGVTKYARANYTNNSFSDLANMLFYNSEKLGLASQYFLDKGTNNASLTRIVDFYKLYYKEPANGAGDSTFLYVITTHLKAGSTTSDVQDRGFTAEAIMAHLATLPKANYIISGDFNLQSSNEVAFQNLTNYTDASIRFYDPVNQIGSWNNNANFASVHTQSTHVTSNGCASGGGMDDRFDFVLMNDYVRDNMAKVVYVEDSYTAVGQDGQRFNQDVNSPTNSSVPSSVANALYAMSDHLPVTMKLAIEFTEAQGINVMNNLPVEVRVVNPVESALKIKVSRETKAIKIVDISGRTVFEKNTTFLPQEWNQISVDFLKSGIYFVEVTTRDGQKSAAKIIKN